MGLFVGFFVGYGVGTLDGGGFGLTVGFFVGNLVGAFTGLGVGFLVGPFVGLTLGFFVGNYFFWANSLQLWNPLLFPKSFKYLSIALLLILLFWLIVIRKNWIKIPAFSYAERLCEAIESL